jgi:hypothetical protein
VLQGGYGKVENRVYHFAHSSTAATDDVLPLPNKINFGCFQTALFLTSPPFSRAGKQYKFKLSEVDEWVREGKISE